MPQKNVSCLIFLRLKYICIISICVYYYTLKDLRKFLGYTLKTANAIENQATLASQYEKII